MSVQFITDFECHNLKFSLDEKPEGFYLFDLKIAARFLSILPHCILLLENVNILLQDVFTSTIL